MRETILRSNEKYGIFSFFTGAGFLDLGFEDAGFVPMMANEIDENCLFVNPVGIST